MVKSRGWHGEQKHHRDAKLKSLEGIEKNVKHETTIVKHKDVEEMSTNEKIDYLLAKKEKEKETFGLDNKSQVRTIERELGSKVVNNYEDSRGNIIKLEDGREYIVYKTEDEAEEGAKLYVRQMLEEEPETFDKNFLKNHTSLSDCDRRMIANDMSDNYASDIRDEDDGKRLIDEADMEEEYGELEEKLDSGKINVEQFKNEIEFLLDKAEEEVRNEMYDDHYERLKDPYNYFVEDEGLYTSEEFFKQYPNAIDLDEASEEAVRIDGIAHFLAGYDGESVYFKDGSVGYRVN